ncbi:unnamed protein product, partial [Darwinula stevensoni]
MEEKTESKRRKTLERELEWVRMGAKGRQAKGKARLSAYDKLQNEETREKEAKLELFIPPGDRLGIIGPNGVGKSTLFRMIMGNEQPDSGSITIGDTVHLSYVDQSHADLKPDLTVMEAVGKGLELIMVGKTQVNVRAYLSGERNRVHLAMTLKEGGNVLLLDEPTNDIDVNTLRALEEAIENFAGCVMVISHDRWFID